MPRGSGTASPSGRRGSVSLSNRLRTLGGPATLQLRLMVIRRTRAAARLAGVVRAGIWIAVFATLVVIVSAAAVSIR